MIGIAYHDARYFYKFGPNDIEFDVNLVNHLHSHCLLDLTVSVVPYSFNSKQIVNAFVLTIGQSEIIIPLRESICYLCTCLWLPN